MTTNQTTVITPWPAPHGAELVDAVPGTQRRLDTIYDLLSVEPINRNQVRRALDNLTRHLDNHIHTAVRDLATESC